MVIETNLHLGNGIVRGNAFSIRRTIPGLATGVTVSSAYCCLEQTPGSTDLFNLPITSASSAYGQIENIGSDGVATLRFDFSAANTTLMTANVQYYFNITLTLSDGSILTTESGVTSAQERVGP